MLLMIKKLIKDSGILYSIAESAKANGLKPLDYLKYMLEQILLHFDDENGNDIDFLVP